MEMSLEDLQEVLDKINDTVGEWTLNSTSFLSAQQELPMTKTSSPSIKLLLQQTMELDLKKTIIYLDYENIDKVTKVNSKVNPMKTHNLNPILSHIKVLMQKSNPANQRGYDLLKLLLNNRIIYKIFTAYLTDRYPNPHGMQLLYGEGYISKSTAVLETRAECQLARMIVSMLHIITNTITGQQSQTSIGNYKFTYDIETGILTVSDDTNHLFLTSYYGSLHVLTLGRSNLFSSVVRSLSDGEDSAVTVHDTVQSLSSANNILGRLRDIEEYPIPSVAKYTNNPIVCRAVCNNVRRELNRFDKIIESMQDNSIHQGKINEYFAYMEYYLSQVVPIVRYSVVSKYYPALRADLVLTKLRNSELTEGIKQACERLSNYSESKIKRNHFYSVPYLNKSGFIGGFGANKQNLVSKSSALNKLNKIKEKAKRGTIRYS